MKNLYFKLRGYFNREGAEALEDLNYDLKHGGVNFDLRFVNDESGSYIMAESTNLKDKDIITTGANLTELESNIKDAIFSAYGVPSHLCNDDFINLPELGKCHLKYATLL